ncbi:hypothetical protein E3N88_22146 [Mikania micrantha]|uniref:Tubby C-terminal domain-containing protein n=1 Tax=Mikania micrantha TaxID=192012 RepID=A0A5N6NC61_9ASTR|nr:hypothetical protein E3N88_22146 [Mikania micrantha]
MTKVHPKAVILPIASSDVNPVVLTVWKKSLLFNCEGFTVFDTKGNLVFRVDNYAAANKAEVFLMDAAGRSLLTIRRKSSNKKIVAYTIEGSYAQRSCVVYDDKRRRVAEIKRKEAVGGVAFGGDVFRLVVLPEIDSAVAMALLVVLDRMFGGSSRRFYT